MGEHINEYTVLDRIFEGRRPLELLGVKEIIILKAILKK
jgi:hypothetical protein